jgi:hypothetical protein
MNESRRGRAIIIAALALLAVVFIGGLTQVSRHSHADDANTDRSFAALGGVVARQSNATSGQARQLLANLPADRRKLQAGLDSLVDQTSSESAHADLAAGTSDPGTLAGNFASVFEDRARAMSDWRSAVDGFLGMHPLPEAGAPATDPFTSPRDLLSASDATNRLAAAGVLLSQSDQLYASVRTALANAPGQAHLPRSVWVVPARRHGHTSVSASQVVEQMSKSAALQGVHDLVLRTVRFNPPVVPASPSTPAGTSTLTPTTHVGVTVVVANEGTADEAHATLRYILDSAAPSLSKTLVRTAPVLSGGSVALPEVTFAVKPGSTYVLTLAIAVPPGQRDLAGTAQQQTLQVAPAT